MIKCNNEKIIISGHFEDVMAEYGMISEKLIISAPKEEQMKVAYTLTEMLKRAIENFRRKEV